MCLVDTFLLVCNDIIHGQVSNLRRNQYYVKFSILIPSVQEQRGEVKKSSASIDRPLLSSTVCTYPLPTGSFNTATTTTKNNSILQPYSLESSLSVFVFIFIKPSLRKRHQNIHKYNRYSQYQSILNIRIQKRKKFTQNLKIITKLR